MRTVGELLKNARRKKGYSFGKIEEETKIKIKYLKALEKEEWASLPDFSVVVGFVKNVAGSLGVDQKQAVALLRRDYPVKKGMINPRPDALREFRWSPKLTFFVGVVGVFLLVAGYLAFQYYRFLSPPELLVEVPSEGMVVGRRELKVSGDVDGDAIVRVNNQPALVEDDGSFSAEIELVEGENEVVVRAVSRSGREVEIRRQVEVVYN